MDKPILVIGAAHLDIVGEYKGHVASDIDKPGEIVYSVGGTAYNIASNLAQNGVDVSFMTFLKADSLVQPIIMARLKGNGIDTAHVVISAGAAESGFIAERRDGALISAVTASTMDDFNCTEDQLRAAMEPSSLVVVDCNVSAIFLNRVQQCAFHEGKRLVVACVSQRKALRTQQTERNVGDPRPFFLLSMNHEEAAALRCPIDARLTPEEATAVCQKFGAETIIITRGADGFIAYSHSGEVVSFPAPMVSSIVSVTGAGDALLSALCLSVHRRSEIDWDDAEKTVARLVSAVLASPGGTVGARTHPEELRVVPKAEIERLRALERETVFKILGEPIRLFGKTMSMGTLVTIVSVAVAVLALGYQVFKDNIHPNAATATAAAAPQAVSVPHSAGPK